MISLAAMDAATRHLRHGKIMAAKSLWRSFLSTTGTFQDRAVYKARIATAHGLAETAWLRRKIGTALLTLSLALLHRTFINIPAAPPIGALQPSLGVSSLDLGPLTMSAVFFLVKALSPPFWGDARLLRRDAARVRRPIGHPAPPEAHNGIDDAGATSYCRTTAAARASGRAPAPAPEA